MTYVVAIAQLRFCNCIENWQVAKSSLDCAIADETAGATYDMPSGVHSELAAIIPGEFTYGGRVDSSYFVRDIQIYPQHGAPKRIDERHHLYYPLHFPLAFPNGEAGWRPKICRYICC